jgi:hypothetical protein
MGGATVEALPLVADDAECAVSALEAEVADLGLAASLTRRVRADLAIDVCEPVQATRRRQPPVDRRCSEPALSM